MPNVIITGVSSGLGAALFDELYGRGDRIIALGRRFTDRQRALAADQPSRVVLRKTDLARTDLLPGPAELADLLAGGGDSDSGDGDPAGTAVLIHNAGVVEPIGAVGALDPVQVNLAVAVNFTAVLLLTNAFLAAAERAPRVRVLFVSSGAAEHVVQGWATYCATKAGGAMFMDVLADQVAGDPRVSIASVNPGVMDTPMQRTIRAASSEHFPRHDRYVGLYARGELPSPVDVARSLVDEHLSGPGK